MILIARLTLPAIVILFSLHLSISLLAQEDVDQVSDPSPVGHSSRVSEGIHFPIDHVAVILDQETLEAMTESLLLRNEFATSASRQSGEGTMPTGLFLYGQHTQYLEFVTGTQPAHVETKPGDGMIAFNAEKQGSVNWIISQMSRAHPESHPTRSLKNFNLGKDAIPYAHVATFSYDSGHQGIGAWVLELQQEFKNRMSGGRVEVGEISRVRYGPAVRHDPERYFQDVKSVVIAAPEVRRRELADLLSELGYEVLESGDSTLCVGSENVIKMIDRTDQDFSIPRIEVSLMRPKEGPKVYQFGQNVTLTFGDSLTAVFDFGRDTGYIRR